MNVHTRNQAIEYLSTKLRVMKSVRTRTKQEEVKYTLDSIILSHVEMQDGDYLLPYIAKTRFLALMIRRIIEAIDDPTKIDDKDYCGNKRLELAGQLISLLFQDLFMRYVDTLKATVE